MIIYQKWGVSQGAKATTRGFIIFVDPDYRDDPGLVPHEQVHVDQFWRTFGLHPFLYRFSKNYRFKAEVAAYKEQLWHYPVQEYPRRLKEYADFLVSHYDLDIDYNTALAALKEI